MLDRFRLYVRANPLRIALQDLKLKLPNWAVVHKNQHSWNGK